MYVRECLNMICIQRVRQVIFYYPPNILQKGTRIRSGFQPDISVKGTPLPVAIWIAPAFEWNNDIKGEMGVGGNILEYTGDDVIRTSIQVHPNRSTDRVFV